MQMQQLYQQLILDHYKHPHGRGLRETGPGESSAQVHHVNPTCGDEVTLRVALSADGTTVSGVSYDGQGCSISQAATSMLTDLVTGEPVAEAMATVAAFDAMVTSRGTVAGDEDVLGDAVAFAGVSKYPARVKCALLGWMAFKTAVSGMDTAVSGMDTAVSGMDTAVSGMDTAVSGMDTAVSGINTAVGESVEQLTTTGEAR